MNKIFFLALFLCASIVRADLPEKHFNPELEKLDKLYCESKDQEFRKLANAIDPSNELYPLVRISLLRYEDIKNETRVQIEAKLKNSEGLSDLERIEYTFMNRKEKDQSKNLKLLNFKSNSPTIEAFRYFYLGRINWKMNDTKSSLGNVEEALRVMPFIDANMVGAYILFAATVPEVKKNLKAYQQYVDLIPPGDSDKYFLKGRLSLFENGPSADETIANFKKAYELCPKSRESGIEYARGLMLKHQLAEAEPIFLELIKDPDHSPLIDLYLAQTYYHLHQAYRADHYIDLAMAKREQTSPNVRKQIERWKKGGQRMADLEYLFEPYILFFILHWLHILEAIILLLPLGTIAWWFRRSRSIQK